MAPKTPEEQIEFLCKVFEALGEIKPDYVALAANTGINNSHNAQRQFKQVMDAIGTHTLVSNRGTARVVPVAAATPASSSAAVNTAATTKPTTTTKPAAAAAARTRKTAQPARIKHERDSEDEEEEEEEDGNGNSKGTKRNVKTAKQGGKDVPKK